MAVPSPEQQVLFLQNVQRLLSDGLFVASYKYALLRALADLAVTKGDDSGAELEIHVSEIAEVFVELYWRQTRPFPLPSQADPLRLRQNTGQQAAIIEAVAQAQQDSGMSLARLRRDRTAWNKLLRDVGNVVTVMPLWKLQRVGDEVADFLYPNVGKGRSITLRPGAAYCLRRFYGLLRNLIEGAWLNFVRSVNGSLLGQTVDLNDFLFGAGRAGLERLRPMLRDLQRDECFYCRRPLKSTGDIDHFVPWSRYPLDLGHNFVLAHQVCNGRKSDHLAAEEHLAAWVERNDQQGRVMVEWLDQVQAQHDLDQSVSIAGWAYQQAATSGGLVWVRGAELRHLGAEWKHLLAAVSRSS